jgi:hypothetical protein
MSRPSTRPTLSDAMPRGVRALAMRALAVFAFVVTVLLPLRASATIIPTCENDTSTKMPVTLEMSCEEAAEAAVAEGTPAPICDPAGASAIAPPRILPIPDARIEAAPICGEKMSVGPSIGPRTGDHPALSSPAILDQTTLLDDIMVPPAPFLESVDAPPPAGGPSAGVRDDVYHPPR